MNVVNVYIICRGYRLLSNNQHAGCMWIVHECQNNKRFPMLYFMWFFGNGMSTQAIAGIPIGFAINNSFQARFRLI